MSSLHVLYFIIQLDKNSLTPYLYVLTTDGLGYSLEIVEVQGQR